MFEEQEAQKMEAGAAYAHGISQAVTSQVEARPEVQAVEALRQIARSPAWDGNLISKSQRDNLYKAGLIDRSMGWNFITSKGVEYAVTLGILRA